MPSKFIDEEFVHRTPQYIKYFDYPIEQALADHSTDPLENVSRQYAHRFATTMSSEGRFVNHEMIIRRNGETTILRPKQDVVLVHGFTPVIRPSSKLPSHQSLIAHPQINSSVSMMTKMSMKICEQTPIIKTKGKYRRARKRSYHISNQQTNRPNCQIATDNKSFPNNEFAVHQFEHDHLQKSHLFHLVEQALHNFIDRVCGKSLLFTSRRETFLANISTAIDVNSSSVS